MKEGAHAHPYKYDKKEKPREDSENARGHEERRNQSDSGREFRVPEYALVYFQRLVFKPSVAKRVGSCPEKRRAFYHLLEYVPSRDPRGSHFNTRNIESSRYFSSQSTA